jgi:penicillin-binding protein 1C
VKTGNVLAYVGNTNAGSEHGDQVDVITAPRSTGSILKPFLYAAMMDEGKILPGTLVPDVPTVIDGFSPKNFSHSYDGAVHANKALIRSLNIPAVYELKEYRYEKFYNLLKSWGLTTLNRPADHYGLSLILGGSEGTLWDITGAYASMARTLNRYFEFPGKRRYQRSSIHPPRYVLSSETDTEPETSGVLSAASIWLTFDALKELYRPGEETGWRYFNSTKKIAWKTGTSFGFRDAWAVGVNPDYAVGVWVGNADGEGRPGLTGSDAAAPLLFDLFSTLPGQSWFQQPVSEMVMVETCVSSGLRSTALCESAQKQWIVRKGLETLPCMYHKRIHLDMEGNERVNSDCFPLDKMKTVSWFILPPIQEYFYRSKNISYQPVPPYKKECRDPSSLLAMDIVYPKEDAEIFVPRELNGALGQTLFEVVHRSSDATVFWHLDGSVVGVTKKSHRLAFAPEEGEHLLTLVDEKGEILSRSFKVLSNP